MHHKMIYVIYLIPLMGRCGHTDTLLSLLYVFGIRVLFPGGGVSLNDSDYLDVGKIMFELAKEVLRHNICYNRETQYTIKVITLRVLIMEVMTLSC